MNAQMFRPRALVLVAVLILGARAAAAEDVATLTRTLDRLAPRVLIVRSALGAEARAFLVAPDRLLVPRDLLLAPGTPTVHRPNGTEVAVRGVLADDVRRDLVLLSVEGADTEALRCGELEIPGRLLALAGDPYGLPPELLETRGVAVRQVPGVGTVLQFSGQVDPRVTGAPLVAADGTCVGVALAWKGVAAPLIWALPEGIPRSGPLRSLDAWRSQASVPPRVAARRAVLAALAAGRWEQALTHTAALGEVGGDEALLWRGHALNQLGRFREARAAFEAAQGVPQRADERALAMALAEQGRHSAAAPRLLAVLQADPQDHELWHALAECHAALGDRAASAEAWRGAVRSDPRCVEAHTQRAIQLAALGRREEALTSLDRALAIDRDQHEAHHQRALMLHRLERFQDARAAYLEGMRTDPKCAGVWADAAATANALKRYREGAAWARRAVELDSRHGVAWNNLGVASYALKDGRAGFQAFREAARLAPRDANTQSNYGWALMQNRRYKQAVPYLKRAVELDGRNVNARSNLVGALVGAGRVGEALPHLAALLKLDPQRARKIRRALGL